MMRPRSSSPHPVVEHFIDCAAEAGELDECSAMTLRLYGDDEAMLPTSSHPPTTWRDRQERCLEFVAMADGLLPGLPAVRLGGLVRLGLRGIVHQVEQVAETFSNWAIDDSVEGGDLLPFRQRLRSRNGVVFKRTMRRLRAPDFVRRYVRQNADQHAAHLRRLAGAMLRRATEFGARADPTIMEDWRVQMNHRTAREERLELRRRRLEVSVRKADRRAIFRSWKAAVAVLDREAVTAFLRGEELKLLGDEAILVVRKRGALADRGPGCLSVGLADRNGTRLADLCTYVKDTPTLDQLAAFALWMRAGEERKVLAAANLIGGAAADAVHHPLLVARHADVRREREIDRAAAIAELTRMLGPRNADRIVEIMNREDRVIPRQPSYEQRRARNDAYWNETKDSWTEAVLAYVVGRRNFSVFKST